ncbi:RES family NAD+ phosphorylase [Thalassotalea piscium]|uniref:RES domain-containing protein n=1 Tax=Thalassotalea piscium TaxID=1230533 RepID=A0A7X0TSA7_9GAMM|nr:RES family NAD+ phosphorylase [Thalassotalea piscium]MBB6541948.1 hypothetical protein [Thalassotalea piscium]
MVKQYKSVQLSNQKAYRLVNSKYPPISLFDDVANSGEFEALYQLQALTNPRLLTEVGDLNLLTKQDIPFGIPGCSYAIAPFTHINPEGSRFSNGDYGVLYLADTINTAIAETLYHQNKIFQNIKGLHYDVVIMRGLTCIFSGNLVDLTGVNEGIYDPIDTGKANALGIKLKKAKAEGVQFNSVRYTTGMCWGLFTPKNILSIKQTAHYQYTFDGQEITKVEKLALV